jgi:hypothetical protein
MDTPNPNVCPTCGSRNTGVSIGFEPQHLSTGEVLLRGTMHSCRDCEQDWAAFGHIMLVNVDNEPYTEEGLAVLQAAIADSDGLRIVLSDED